MPRLTAAALALAILPLSAPAEEIVIFLHNGWYEKNREGEAHPTFGAYDFDGIVAALGHTGTIEAPLREAGTDPKAAAEALEATIRAAIEAGRAPGEIKVIGTSKGGFVAQLASASLDEPDLRWVIVGACHDARLAESAPPPMTGRVLSIYDRSDSVAGSCSRHAWLYENTAAFEETALDTGQDHGFQFTADPAWITPARAW